MTSYIELSHKYSSIILSEFISNLKSYINECQKIEKIIDVHSRRLKMITTCVYMYNYINNNLEYVVRASNIIINETVEPNTEKIKSNMRFLYIMYKKIFSLKDDLNEIIKEDKKFHNKNKDIIQRLFELLDESKDIFENLHLQIPHKIIANKNIYSLQPISSVNILYHLKISYDYYECNIVSDTKITSIVTENKKIESDSEQEFKPESENNSSSQRRVSKTKSQMYRENRPKRNVPIVNYAGMQ